MKLDSPVTSIPFVGSHYAKKLEKLGISKIEDLVTHIPSRYLDFSKSSKIARSQIGETLTIKGEVVLMKNQYTKTGKKMQIATVSDNTGNITVVWFNQPFLIRVLYPGVKVSLAGKIDWFGRRKALISPEYEIEGKGTINLHTGRLVPIYPETSGLSSKWLRSKILTAISGVINNSKEFLPESTLKNLNLNDLVTSFKKVHSPTSFKEAEKARERLAFNELLFLQLSSLQRKISWEKTQSVYKLKFDSPTVKEFTDSLPFILTPSQVKAVEEILIDLKKDYPMNRLLEGDVGSGKTVVGAIASFISFINGYQSVFMAPTQILASQHYQTLSKLFHKFKVRTSLITSSDTRLDLGRSDIFVGTHALIHRKVPFEKVALVIIDEQHRFGVEQRAHLTQKVEGSRFSPHVLTMTATPIPRTVALTVYGDLNLSTLKDMPKGRKKITTWIVPPVKRKKAYEWIGKKIKEESTQAFVVCPLIEDSLVETLVSVKSATKVYEEVKKIFKGMSVGLLHGRLKPKEKDKAIEAFRKGEVNILVTTPVVEVGIDVPNATFMVIEGAERFGLAALHQLRGRVGRSGLKSYCLVITESRSKTVTSRLWALEKNLSGFELAELDLKLRGPGEIFGVKQSGFHDLKIATWGDTELIKQTRGVAEEAFRKPKEFSKLFKELENRQKIAN